LEDPGRSWKILLRPAGTCKILQVLAQGPTCFSKILYTYKILLRSWKDFRKILTRCSTSWDYIIENFKTIVRNLLE
jgi:hypothetical protein